MGNSDDGKLDHIAEGLRPLAVPIDLPVLDPANPRVGHDLQGIAASLRLYGQRTPIVINTLGNRVLKGNGTLKAARSIGWETIAALQVSVGVSDGISYSLADNRLADKSLFDFPALDKLLSTLDDPLDIPGIDAEWLDEVLSGLAPDPPADPGPQVDKAAELQEKWRVKSGDLWGLGAFTVCPKCGKVHNLD